MARWFCWALASLRYTNLKAMPPSFSATSAFFLWYTVSGHLFDWFRLQTGSVIGGLHRFVVLLTVSDRWMLGILLPLSLDIQELLGCISAYHVHASVAAVTKCSDTFERGVLNCVPPRLRLLGWLSRASSYCCMFPGVGTSSNSKGSLLHFILIISDVLARDKNPDNKFKAMFDLGQVLRRPISTQANSTQRTHIKRKFGLS